MDDSKSGPVLPPATWHAAAVAASMVVVAELARLVGPGLSGSAVLWLVREILGGAGAVFALVMLRRCLGDALNMGSLLRWLCIVQGLLPAMWILRVLGRGGSPRILTDLLAVGTDLLALVALVLFAAATWRIGRTRAPGLVLVTAFAGLAATGHLLSFFSVVFPMGVEVAVHALAYGLLGVFFARGAWAPDPARRAARDPESAPVSGWLAFAMVVVGLAALLTAMLCIAEAMERRVAGPLTMLAAWFMGPQWMILDTVGLEAYPILLFPLALVTFPIVLLPLGIQLIASRPKRRWVTVVLQVGVLLAYLVFGFLMAISGIQG